MRRYASGLAWARRPSTIVACTSSTANSDGSTCRGSAANAVRSAWYGGRPDDRGPDRPQPDGRRYGAGEDAGPQARPPLAVGGCPSHRGRKAVMAVVARFCCGWTVSG
jgi:hypothetical protein